MLSLVPHLFRLRCELLNITANFYTGLMLLAFINLYIHLLTSSSLGIYHQRALYVKSLLSSFLHNNKIDSLMRHNCTGLWSIRFDDRALLCTYTIMYKVYPIVRAGEHILVWAEIPPLSEDTVTHDNKLSYIECSR